MVGDDRKQKGKCDQVERAREGDVSVDSFQEEVRKVLDLTKVGDWVGFGRVQTSQLGIGSFLT